MYIMYIMYMTYDIHHSNCLYIYGKHAGKKLGSLLYTCIYIYLMHLSYTVIYNMHLFTCKTQFI